VPVAFAIFALLALAVIVAEPFATLVTGTLTLVVNAGMVMLAGTVATAVLLELNAIVIADLEALESINETFWVATPPIVTMGGKKLSVPFTWTVWVADVRVRFEAVMVADPKSTPVTLGTTEGVVAPCGK